jgi:DNA-binding response OmpR family regulator
VTCPRCEDLREEVEDLKRELGLSIRQYDAHTLRLALRLDAAEASIVCALHQGKGRVISHWKLCETLPTHNEDRYEDGLIKVYISRIRKKIGAQCIRTVWGQGYALTPEGQAKTAEVLA